MGCKDHDGAERLGTYRECPVCGCETFNLWWRTDLESTGQPTAVTCSECGNSVALAGIKDPRMPKPDTEGDRPTTVEELCDEWRKKADELIHEGENEYVEGRGGQLAECARQLERLRDGSVDNG